MATAAMVRLSRFISSPPMSDSTSHQQSPSNCTTATLQATQSAGYRHLNTSVYEDCSASPK
ncbi:hypothetical protein DPMN_037541 [Dreissena polymorpha]|uniref:Uncharacterized protein n=1 Tax=Dreissena polymorpha TaxID=45954 RepID=A0A9D4MEQ5_DREPO|nr:hypothetical protein DPMN_037541 [Dreissena polymorpha]